MALLSVAPPRARLESAAGRILVTATAPCSSPSSSPRCAGRSSTSCLRFKNGLSSLCSWAAWKPLAVAVPQGWKRRRCVRGLVSASLLGVGAPEVLVIAVVALLVFGPKGLAEVAKTLGQSLRAFQPAIRELQEVSRDFKQTLEKEIGLDELNPRAPAPSQSPPKPTVIEELTTQLDLMQQEKAEAATAAPDAAAATSEQTPAAADSEQSKLPSSKPPAAAAENGAEVNNVGAMKE